MAWFAGCASNKAADVKQTGDKRITGISAKVSDDQVIVTIDGNQPLTYTAIKQVFPMGVLFHFPESPAIPLNEKFASYPWQDGRGPAFERWCRGETGIPLVDAGMRELWTHGWMHNRTRMIVASLLTKNLGISWQSGARWFWDTLVDADLASNSMGWQWVAGCGADAAPFYRIFNPVRQGERFDSNGTYVRRWVPELASLPDNRTPTIVLTSSLKTSEKPQSPCNTPQNVGRSSAGVFSAKH